MRAVPSAAAFTWSEAQAGARALSPRSDPLKLLAGCLAAADVGVVLLASMGAYVLRHGPVMPPVEIASTTLLAALLTFSTMRLAGAYGRHLTASAAVQVGTALHGSAVVFVTLVIVAYLTKTSDEFSRAWAVSWYAFVLAGLAFARIAASARIRGWRERGKLARTVAIVDLAGTGEALAWRMMRSAADDLRLVGVFTPQRSSGRKNGVSDLVALSRLFRIDEVLVATSGQRDCGADAVLRKLGTIPTNVRLCPELPRMEILPREAGLMFGQPVLTVYHRPLTGWNRVAKRAEDLILTTLAIIMISPVLLLVAILVKLDSKGPVLFRQQRLGFNNNVITVFKFRSMIHRTEAETKVVQATRNDARFTRIGKFLRRTSLDELPQLFNVLKGEMSLVGPRPHALSHNDQYAALIDGYLGRHRVQPGITGWAQVNGLRGETDTLEKMQQRVQHDMAYIDGWSLLLDIKIILMTALLPISDRNAY